MKTFFLKLRLSLIALLAFPLFYACSDDDNNNMNGDSMHSQNLGIKIAVIDENGHEVISDIKTVMPGVDKYWYDDSSKGLDPNDYTLDIYMDDEFIYSMTNPKEQVDWPVVKEPYEKVNCPWWSINLPGYRAGKKMMEESTYTEAHTIEYHIKHEALFGDTETHVIRFEYKPFYDFLMIQYYAEVYFDDEKVETYYPEAYKVNAEQKGLKFDIDDQYWMEGATGWPIAIIKL